jgi:hypothetical protein
MHFSREARIVGILHAAFLISLLPLSLAGVIFRPYGLSWFFGAVIAWLATRVYAYRLRFGINPKAGTVGRWYRVIQVSLMSAIGVGYLWQSTEGYAVAGITAALVASVSIRLTQVQKPSLA